MKFRAAWKPSSDASVFGIISTFIVGVLAVWLSFGYVNNYSADEQWIETTGTVKEYVEKKRSGENTYLVTSSYRVDGQEFLRTENISANSPPRVGSEKDIAYNPENPAESKVLTNEINLYVSYLMTALGVYFVIVAIISGALKVFD